MECPGRNDLADHVFSALEVGFLTQSVYGVPEKYIFFWRGNSELS